MNALDLCASCQRTFGHEHGLLVHEACVEAGGLSLARAVAAEREACAQICADVARNGSYDGPTCDALVLAAGRIRARST